MNDFFEVAPSIQDHTPGKTIRILVYPNITSKNYETDSYVDALAMMIDGLNAKRSDLFFYIISPKKILKLERPNTHQFLVHIPTHSPTMRLHFDVRELAEVLSHKYDYDLVFSHLPEHTLQIMNLLSYKTHHEPGCFGYCHWFDFPQLVTWENTFWQNIGGLLRMDKCFVNTMAQKKLFLKTVSPLVSDDLYSCLDRTLEPHYLGVSPSWKFPEFPNEIAQATDKIIAFPHRPWSYKDYPNFLKICDALWETRKDFRVWVPLAKTPDREYIFCDKFDKDGYYQFLRNCRVCVSPKQNYAGWSIATTDAMMNGCPVLCYDSDYYRELYPLASVFSDNTEAIKKLNLFLDSQEYRNGEAREALYWCRKRLVYDSSMVSEQIDKSLSNLYVVKTEDAVSKLVTFIEQHGPVSKKAILAYMKWGVSIKWTKYRRALLAHPNIFESKTVEPLYQFIK